LFLSCVRRSAGPAAPGVASQARPLYAAGFVLPPAREVPTVSLRAFHLVFVTVAALASFAFAAWALASRSDLGPVAFGYCALGAVGGLALALWSRRAARELRREA